MKGQYSWLISTKALVVGQEQSYGVYIGQGDFESDCTRCLSVEYNFPCNGVANIFWRL